jgi:hypothetical protein
MKIFATKPTDASLPTLYATGADFCRIFEDNMHRLYLLSLLLTADLFLAKKCFVAGLETSKSSSTVFKDWAQSWARRTIITNAIRIIGPRPEDASNRNRGDFDELPMELAAVISLNAFDRFVFVMFVLEGYAERDCRLLLHRSSSDIGRARARTLDQLGVLANLYGKTIQLQSKAHDRQLTLAPGLVPRLAVSA